MEPFVAQKEEKEEGFFYRLYGVSIHSGGIGGGHYIARVHARPPGRWYSFSDSSGQEIQLADVLNSEAYILFYERVAKKKKEEEEEDS